MNEKIDESRTGNLNLEYLLIIRQGIDQNLRQLARVPARRLCQHHCNVAGKITMGNITRTRYLDFWLH